MMYVRSRARARRCIIGLLLLLKSAALSVSVLKIERIFEEECMRILYTFRPRWAVCERKGGVGLNYVLCEYTLFIVFVIVYRVYLFFLY